MTIKVVSIIGGFFIESLVMLFAISWSGAPPLIYRQLTRKVAWLILKFIDCITFTVHGQLYVVKSHIDFHAVNNEIIIVNIKQIINQRVKNHGPWRKKIINCVNSAHVSKDFFNFLLQFIFINCLFDFGLQICFNLTLIIIV